MPTEGAFVPQTVRPPRLLCAALLVCSPAAEPGEGFYFYYVCIPPPSICL